MLQFSRHIPDAKFNGHKLGTLGQLTVTLYISEIRVVNYNARQNW